MHVIKGWQDLIKELEEVPEWRSVYVLGGTDYGKTTLCRTIVDHLIPRDSTAYIDCDPGQSVVGPPATIGMEVQSKINDEAPAIFLRFVGATSPMGHMLQILTGITRLTEKAVELGAAKIVIDSSGFVFGRPAREFQFQVIDLLQPDYLVAIQEGKELEYLLANFSKNERMKIRRLPISPAAIKRTFEERQSYRMMKFKEYFKESMPHVISFGSLGLHGFVPEIRNSIKCRNLLIALCDQENLIVTLGIVQELNVDTTRITFSSPSFNVSRVTSIQFGSLYLNASGDQLPSPYNTR